MQSAMRRSETGHAVSSGDGDLAVDQAGGRPRRRKKQHHEARRGAERATRRGSCGQPRCAAPLRVTAPLCVGVRIMSGRGASAVTARRAGSTRLRQIEQGARLKGRRRSRSRRLGKPCRQRHDGDRRHDDQQKRDHAHCNAENQEGQCCKHGCHHNDRDRSDDPLTPSRDDNGCHSVARDRRLCGTCRLTQIWPLPLPF
jgi:hypothetical protein